VLSTSSKSFYISYKALRLLSKRTGNSIFIISNSLGLTEHTTSLKQKNGGMLMGFFSF
jgi:ribosomal protein S8